MSTQVKPVPLPTTFSADVVRSDGECTRVFIDGPCRRVEARLGPRQVVYIYDGLRERMFELDPKESTYTETAMPRQAVEADLDDGTYWSYVGREDSLDKYEIRFAKENVLPDQICYVDPETKMQRKLVTCRLTVEWKNVSLARPDPALFKPPPEFTKVT